MPATDRSDETSPSRRARLTGRAGDHRHLLAGSAALVIGAAVQALTGALFWLVAARIDTTDDVGRATALFTSILFISYLSGLGLQVSLARFAPDRSQESHAVFAWGVLATAVSAAVVASGYLLLVDTEATRTLTDWHPVAGPAMFISTSIGAALTLIVDVRWMTVRRWSLVLGRITIVGLLRFVLLLVPTNGAETVHLFAVAAAPLLLTGVAGVVWMPRITGDRHRLFPTPERRRAAVRYSAVNYLSTLAYQAPQFVLPVIVLLSVDPDQNASFYVAWGITTVTLYVPMAIGQALLAEGGKDGTELRGQVRVILVITTALMVVAASATALGRELVTSVYGDDYADAARILPPLVAACIPWAITSVYLTEARVLHRNVDTVVITVALTAAILIPALLLVPDDGLDGATTAFVVGNVVAAVVAAACHIWHRNRRSVPVPDATLADDLVLHP
ncbi:lipopolysaccharide biosynthesis protein [Actinospongicola halichondriae]|uniref:lipopolysaccharide biosynthesis protein n=1 Tax=Actinospongicola halichondriae TaxID=3236844 RepID=UPI003D499A6C